MNQYYLNRHERQIVGFKGLDLAGDRRREIIASARNISRDSVLQFNHTQFHIASQSRSGTFHLIDLNLMTCDCQDFPRIRFCKHIAAIHLHFPHLEQSDPIITREGDPDPDSDSDSDSGSESGSASASEAALPEAILTLTCEIISLSLASWQPMHQCKGLAPFRIRNSFRPIKTLGARQLCTWASIGPRSGNASPKNTG